MPTTKPKISRDWGSYRDPSGFVYYRDGRVFRQIHESYARTFRKIDQSGLLADLTERQWIVPHRTVDQKLAFDRQAELVLEAEKIAFISYPYEWSFRQLTDAAHRTLQIQKLALQKGFSLKDASAYNIQFWHGEPVLIDLLSFEEYVPGKPWVAYQQFCRHFLGPLLLMAHTDLRLNQLLRDNVDGLPLDLVSRLLPKRTYASLPVLLHIHLHARNQRRFGGKPEPAREARLESTAFLALIDNLDGLIRSLSLKRDQTEWEKYYSFTNYSPKAFARKKKIVASFLGEIKPQSVWDLGGNTGEFSRIASDRGSQTVCFDIDPLAVEENYRQVREKKETDLLPLIQDLGNPSPAIGWALQERQSLVERGPADLVMALALVHHLCLSQNIPLAQLADFCRQIGRHLIVEFVPKRDSKVQILLATREDIFPDYDEENFEKAFSRHFRIMRKETVGAGSVRTLYLLKRKT
jgi:hypothetical protein